MTTGLAWTFLWIALAAPDTPLVFDRVRIGSGTYEAASAFDVDRDGALDIVSGAYWYRGPAFTEAVKMCDVQRVDDYYDDFADYPMDVNGDGYLDVVTGGWWGATLRWRENPRGQAVPWPVHDIDPCGNIETIRFWDIDGDGHPEVVPNAGGMAVFYRLVRDATGNGTGTFTKHIAKESGCGHGLGFGDINGDGRGDLIVPDGWLECPEQPLADAWPWHPEFQLGSASVPILVHDVDEDGRADLIVGQAHDYGLDWWEQGTDAAGQRTWTRHPIDPDRSQYHDLFLADLDNDGRPELVTGKRYRAHAGRDPGATDPVGVYAFRVRKGTFERVTLDYGPPDQASGLGIYGWAADLDGDGWTDLLAPGKEGLYLFRNRGDSGF